MRQVTESPMNPDSTKIIRIIADKIHLAASIYFAVGGNYLELLPHTARMKLPNTS
ncbi:MAG: hypothetical protein ACLSE6_05565 [Alphaproteobacteria bacterium]